MMRFPADVGVSQGVTVWLREQGHDVVHLRERGLQRLPNGQIVALAALEDRVILTFDLDFGELVASPGSRIVSVILFRMNNTTSRFVTQRLSRVLPDIERPLAEGAIVVIEDGRHRIRHLPLRP